MKFDVIKYMILEKPEEGLLTVHTEKKIKRRRKTGGGVVSIITVPEGKMYRISFFKRRRLQENSLSRTDITRRGITFLIGIRRSILYMCRKIIYE